MIVYVVASGEITEPRIRAVFADREKAENFCEVSSKEEITDFFITTYDTDNGEEVLGYYFYNILFTVPLDEPIIGTKDRTSRYRPPYGDIHTHRFGVFVCYYSQKSIIL